MKVFRLWRIGIAVFLIASLLAPAAQPVRAATLEQDPTGGQFAGGLAVLDSDLPPFVLSTIPDNGEIALADTNIRIAFSETVAVSGEWFTITCDSGPVTATSGAGPASVYILNPTRILGSSDFCTVTIHHTLVTDVDGTLDQMAADYSWSFLTDIIDNGPLVASTSPVNNAVGVAVNTNLVITFDREVTVGTYTLSCGSTPISSTISNTNKVDFTIDPASALPGGSTCTLTIPADQVTEYAYPYQHMQTDLTLTFSVTFCGTAHTKISAIQQAGAASPLVGQDVTVEGIVTADLQGSSQLNGFFMQSLPGDVDDSAATSEGLFVYTGSGTPVIDVNVGDTVRFSAKVAELTSASAGQMASMTGLNQVAPASLLTCASGGSLPAAQQIDLPSNVDASLYLEAYEGMYVQVTSPLTVIHSAYLARFGQLSLGAYGRIYHPNNGTGTGVEDLRRLLVMDDGSFSEYPFPNPYYSANGAVRAGDTLAGVTGVLDQGRISDNTTVAEGLPDVYYRLQPTSAPLFTPINERGNPPSVGGVIKVAGFNLNDYFITIDNIGLYGGVWPAGSGYSVGSTPRGADSVDEFNRQQGKLVKALAAIQADVFAVSELEAWDGAYAADELAQALNTELAAPDRYAAVVDPVAGENSDLTQVALIYNTTTLTLVGSSLGIANAIFDHAPVAQRFQSGNESFWVVANQFKTRGDCPLSGPDADQGDGQGCWNATRQQQAAALAAFVNTSLKPVDPDVLVVGDLNAYAAEQPAQALVSGGLINQVQDNVPELQRYSIIANNLSGYVDHAFSTPSITRQLAGVEFWTINADEPAMIDYNTENKRFNSAPSGSPDLYQSDPYASSDHDPLLIGLTLFANQAPQVANPLADQQAVQDAPFTFLIPANTFSDANTGQMNGREDSLTYSAALSNGSPLPGWLSFSAPDGEFSGIPAASDVGTIAVKVTVVDTSGASTSDTFNIVVDASNHPPVVNGSVADQVAYPANAFSLVLASDTFTDQDPGDVLVYSATLANDSPLPAWLNFDPATRTFSGTPGSSDFGQITIKVTVTDQGNATASLTFKLDVTVKLFLPILLNIP